MTEWIKCSDRLPKSKRNPACFYGNDESYNILVSIGGKCFVGTARTLGSFYILIPDEILFDLYALKWVMPVHYKQPDFWIEIPEVPNV